MVVRGGSTSFDAARAVSSKRHLPTQPVPVFTLGQPDGRSQDTGAHLGLQTWTSRADHGILFYTNAGRQRMTAGLPRCSSAELGALYAEFRESCRQAGVKPLHFGITPAALEFLPDVTAHSCWHVGDLPIVDLARWRNDRLIPRAIRTQILRARNHHVVVTHWAKLPLDQTKLNALCAARDLWLAAKPLPPLVFMTTPFVFEPWPHEGVFVAEVEGKIVGFLVASRALFGDLYRVDAVARVPGAPNGTAELLVREAFRHAAEQGIAKATLGLAPLSQRSRAANKKWSWGWMASGLSRRFGRSLYSFAGLEGFKAKFAPEAWVPLYCVSPGRRFGPRDVLAVARVFAGESLPRYALRLAVRSLKHTASTGR